jgi:hypothetical protein
MLLGSAGSKQIFTAMFLNVFRIRLSSQFVGISGMEVVDMAILAGVKLFESSALWNVLKRFESMCMSIHGMV